MNAAVGTAHTNPIAGSFVPVQVKTRYTKSLDTTGWLRVRLEPSGTSAYLCEFVKIVISREDDRTHFQILEGEYKGKAASLAKENAAKCLVDGKRGQGAKLVAKVGRRQWLESKPRGNQRHNQLVSTLFFDGQSAMITLDSDVQFEETNPLSPNRGKVLQSKPLPRGIYKIMAPTHPHKAAYTQFYVTAPGGNPDLKYHTVWFPIEYAPTHNSNFVHVGNLSEGCVTMYDLTKWNALYRYLISNRVDKEGKYVGTVTIE
jgi:hypothetical protein